MVSGEQSATVVQKDKNIPNLCDFINPDFAQI